MNDNASSHRDPNAPELPVELEAWLEEQSPEDVAEIKTTWRLAEHARLFDPPAEPDQGRFERLKRDVRASMKDSEVTLDGRLRLHWLGHRVLRAASVVLLLVVAGAFWASRPVIYEAPSRMHLAVHLIDGTEISLNSGSSLSHHRFFGWFHRDVLLHGEAYFDVAHSEKPFSVETFNGKVTVLGTRFSVRAWHNDDEPETVVVLEEGSIEFASHLEADRPVILKPGELSRISDPMAPPTAPESVDVNQRLSWRQGGLLFVDLTMGAAVAEIRRRFDVDVELVPDSLRNQRITLLLDDAREVQDVLDTIAGTLGYEIERLDGHYRLSKP